MRKFLPLILILLAVGAYFYFNSQKTVAQKFPDAEAQLILFWGDGCPHCEVVKTFIKDNNLENKVKIAYKEVYMDKNNQKLLETTIQKCPEIDSSRGIGVPLAFDTQAAKCFYGDTPIIDWLKAR